jgi:hypothetical protein
MQSGKGSIVATAPYKPTSPDARKIDLKDVASLKAIEPGSIVLSASVFPDSETGGFDLLLGLSDWSKIVFRSLPAIEVEDQEDDLPAVADWELFTPYDRYLKVGPGPKWEYTPSKKTT